MSKSPNISALLTLAMGYIQNSRSIFR